jgi:hypothetical protein
MISDRKITRGPAHRTNITIADAGPDISSSVGALMTLDNQIHVECSVECSAAAVTGSVCLARWDANGVFMGITEAQTFTAHSTWRNGTGGPFVTPPLIFDVMGATQVKALVSSLSGGNIINLYLLPLSLYSY